MDFFNKYKKLFAITGFVLIVILLGYLLYSMFFKPATETPSGNQPVSTSTPSGLPTAQVGPGGQIIPDNQTGSSTSGLAPDNSNPASQVQPTATGGLTKTQEVVQTASLGATSGSNGSGLQYYNKEDGKFYKLDQNGNPVTLSDTVFHDVQNVVWSPAKNKAILEYPDGAKIIYDFSGQKQITIPSHWKDFSFSPDGSQIVMKSIGQDPSNRWLATVNSDGTQVKGIESLGDKDETVFPAWSPNNQVAAVFTEGKDFDNQEVYFVGLNNENFKSTIVPGRGFDPQWSPVGDKLLYSVYSTASDMKPGLWVVDAQGDNIGNNRINLNLNTWADKCSFTGNQNLYCAVPNNLDQGAGLFPELAKNTTDSLYQVDVKTGNKKRIAIPEGDYTITNVTVTDNNQNLYFTDEKTGKIYKIKLK